jgi:hypothetical protein
MMASPRPQSGRRSSAAAKDPPATSETRVRAAAPVVPEGGAGGGAGVSAARPISEAHYDLAASTLHAFECLSEAQGAAAHLMIYLEGDGKHADWRSVQEAFAALVSALHLTGAELAGMSRRLTGRHHGSSAHASHVRALAELVTAASRPEVAASCRDDLLTTATRAFVAAD